MLPPCYEAPSDLIGHGGFGTVYLSRELESGLPVAVKIPHRGADPDALAREITAEVQASALLRHPCIVQVLDAGEDPTGVPWLVMEYAGAGSLADWIARPPPWERVAPVLLDLLDGLAHAHARGLVHRDIKPANVLLTLTADGSVRPRLADFGLAKVRQDRGDYRSTRLMAGTLLYMAPEAFTETTASIHPAFDLYSFGVLLYELVSELRPWDGGGLSLVMQKTQRGHRPLKPRAGYPVPAGLADLADRLLRAEPSERPQLASEVRRELEELSGSKASPDAFPPLPPPPSAGPRQVRPALALHREPRIVGREVERSTLWQAARAAETEPAGICLSGAAGSGRSTLCADLCERLEERGIAHPLRIRLEADDALVLAVERAIRGWLGLGRLLGEELLDRVKARAAGLGLASEDSRGLASWLDPGVDSTTMGGLDEADPGASALLASLLRASARRGRAVLWIEDRSPRAGARRLVEDLLRAARLDRVPLLLLYEPVAEVCPTGFERLDLPVLPDADVSRIIDELAPDRVGPAEVARARGNPRRAVERARLLAAQTDGIEPAAAAASAEQALTLPRIQLERLDTTHSVQDLARARLDGWFRGPEQAPRRTLVALLALLPSPVHRSELVAAWSGAALDDDLLDATLQGAMSQGLVLLSDGGEHRLQGPALVRAAEQVLGEHPEEASLAAAAGAALRDQPEIEPDRLAAAGRLLLRGELPEQAAEVAVEAAVALDGRDLRAANRAWELAAEALSAAGAALPDPRAVRVTLGSARLARTGGDLDGAARLLEQLVSVELAPEAEAEWRELRASVHLLRGEADAALDEARRAARLYQQPGGRSRALLLEADALRRSGLLAEALPVFEAALAVAQGAGRVREQLGALHRLARVRLQLGWRDPAVRERAREELTRALDLAEGAGAGNYQGILLRELGNLEVREGRSREAALLLRRSIDQLRRCGQDGEAATTRISLGELARAGGDLRGARQEYSVALEVTRAFGITQDAIVALFNLAVTELALDRPGQAARRVRTIDELLPRDRPHGARDWIEAARLGVAARQGRWDDAEDALDTLRERPEGRGADTDLVALVERAGDDAAAGDERGLAAGCWGLARELVSTLGDAEAAQRLQGKLTGLL